MTLIQERRNSVQVICTFITLLAAFLLPTISINGATNAAYAQRDPFETPLDQLKKVNPEHVVSFRVIENPKNSQNPTSKADPARVVLEMNTRAGFKIYGKGLQFTYRPADNPLPVSLEFTPDPVALTAMDPWYNEMRSVHLGGTRFVLQSPIPLTPVGHVAVKFEACSVSNCLLPTTFVMRAAVGALGKPEKRSASAGTGIGNGNDLLGGSFSAETSSSQNSNFSGSLSAETPALQPNIEPSTAKIEPEPAQPGIKLPTTSQPSLSGRVTTLTDTVSLWVQNSLTNRSWTLFLWLFVAGLLMNLTPCVYPMIPITLNVLSSFGQHTNVAFGAVASEAEMAARNRRRRLLPFVYVAGMVLSYSAMGVVAGMTGTLFGSLLQSSAVTVGLAVIMFAMGLSMLGVFNMTAVQSFATRIPIAEKYPVAGVLTMGAVSGLVSAPCTGPVLSALLLLIGQSKDPVYGFTLMLFFALGFGAPYILLGLFTQRLGRLPKAGLVLRSVKVVFAALLFALALYYIKPILGRLPIVSVVFQRPTSMAILATALFAIVFALLGKLKGGAKGTDKNFATWLAEVGVVTSLTFLALWLTLSVTSGFMAPYQYSEFSSEASTDGMNANKNSDGSAAENTSLEALKPSPTSAVKWEKDWRKAVQRATVERKPMMVDAWADWCAACLKMDETLWKIPDVAKVLNERFVPVKLDFTRSTEFSEQMITRWELSGLPAVGFFPAGGNLEGVPPVLFREAIDEAKFNEAIKPYL